MSPHISIKGEVVYELFGFPITNTIVTTVIVLIAFFFIARYFYSQIQKSDRSLAFYALHGIIVAIYNLFESVLGKKINYFFPLLGSFFVFILMMNWSGLFPGVGSILIEPPKHEVEVTEDLVVPEEEAASPVLEEEIVGVDEHADEAPEEGDNTAAATEEVTEEHEGESAEEKHYVPLMRGGTADLNTTLALALVSVFVTQIYGFKFLGPKAHLAKYFDFRDPIMIMLGPLELIQEFARIVSFAFRLYGNIFAGEVLLTIIPFLLPVFLSFFVTPIFFMEIFVGVVQALVFTMLSAVFINMATAHHH
ncbi:F0F1 ATP synthase subunit A [Candidatus Roizmanbacteria bacterium]|nr:MAG: F0F1 ATP synthase subunit A [Candidatus Roizmanbacteria bacterium]